MHVSGEPNNDALKMDIYEKRTRSSQQANGAADMNSHPMVGA